MAVLLSALKNQVATSVASKVSQFAKMGTSAGASPLQALTQQNNFSSTSSKNLAYPLNVEDDPEQGHYIIFYIYEIDDVKVKKKGDAIVKAARGNGTAANRLLQNSDSTGMNSQSGRGAGKSLSIKRPPMKRMDQAIALYMPASVKVSYKTNYSDQEIGLAAQVAGDLYSDLQSGKGLMETGKGALGGLATGVAVKVVDTASKMLPGAKAMAQIASGMAISNKMELQFDGVDRRDFSYEFTFIPKSEQEAKVVEEIVYAFKKNMMPAYQDQVNLGSIMGHEMSMKFNGKVMRTPNIFDIEYQHKGKRNPFLNRVSSSYLTSVDVSYGGDRFKAYESTTTNARKGYEGGGEGPPPQKTTLSLNFREIEMMSRERIEAGF